MHRTMNPKGFLLILAAMMVVFLVFHFVMKGNVDKKAEEEKTLRVKLTGLEEENKDLNARISTMGTQEYIIASAVKDYSYVSRSAIRFEFTNPEALYAYTDEELQILMDEMND